MKLRDSLGRTSQAHGYRWPLVFVMAGLVGVACTPPSARTRGDEASAAANADPAVPILRAITPDTIRLGPGEATTLTLTGSGFIPGPSSDGRGFARGSNTLHVGPAAFDLLEANTAGTTIRFALPLTYIDTSNPTRPSTFVPGDFPVSVTTPHGTSNALTLVMIP